MAFSLKIKLSAAFALVCTLLILILSVFTHISLNANFQKYLIGKQDTRITEVKTAVEQQFIKAGEWRSEDIEAIGMSALEQGLILVLKDRGGATVWDATKHNNGMCEAMLNHMADNMKKEYPDIQGSYVTNSIPIYGVSAQIAMLEIGYYGPFYISDNEAYFMKALNKALIWVALLALVLSVLVGTMLAHKISAPISEVVSTAKEISGGNFSVQSAIKTTTKEINELIATTNELARKLSEQENLRKRFSQDMAHEIRTPMATLQGNMEAMMDGVWAPTPERLKSSYDEIMRINKMVVDLHSVSKFESENTIIQRQKVEMDHLVESVALNFEGEFFAKGVALVQCAEAFTVYTDRDKITQILINLLSNALKYTPEGGRVQVVAARLKNHFELVVEDTGVGIHQEDVPYIFERFYRADPSRNRQTGGTGIGLAVVKAIANALKGEVSVQSTPNCGTKFTVTIPM